MDRKTGLALAGLSALAYYGYRMLRQPTAREQVAEHMQQLTPNQRLARENVMSLIRLRGQARDTPGASNVDVMVHGTFAHGADWAQPDSSFSRRVRNGRNAVTTSFQWSGSGVEQDRQAAGRQLAPFLRDTQRAFIAGNRGTNVIAHSHGGNVLGHALSNHDVNIDNAVLLATPAMSRGGNPNISWTDQGANRVRYGITGMSASDDLIQTVGAQANEWRNDQANRGVLRSGRNFSRPNSPTPQMNMTVRQPQGILAAARDAAAQMAFNAFRTHGPSWLSVFGLGAAASAETARRVQAHSDMHSDLVGGHISRHLQGQESAVGRLFATRIRNRNAQNGVTQPSSSIINLR